MRSTPIIIGGSHRTGSTLLSRILGGHSGIFAPPEIKFMLDLNGGYRNDPLAGTRFFATVESLGLGFDRSLELFGGAYLAALDEATAAAGKRRWADKSPENALYIEQWDRLLAGDLWFVHCVRHPLDLAASLDEVGFAGVLPEDLGKRLTAVRRIIKTGLDRAESHPERTHVVRYEDLAADPAGTIGHLLERVGEQLEESMLDFAATEPMPGLGDRKIDQTTVIHTDSVGRGKRDLSPGQVDQVRTVMGTVAGRLGYDL